MTILAMLATSLLGCSDEPQWHSSTLGTDFPALEFKLQSGEQRISDKQLRGKITLLFFGYLSCPDACPTTMATLQQALQTLPAEQREQVRVVFVSVDPQRDDPQQLAEYAAWFGPQFIGATGDPGQLKELASRYGTSFRREENDRLVIHGTNVLAFDREGRARLLIRHNEGSEAIAHDIRQLVAS